MRRRVATVRGRLRRSTRQMQPMSVWIREFRQRHLAGDDLRRAGKLDTLR